MIKQNEIKVYSGERKILKEEFSTTYYTVRKALAGETSTSLLRHQIRLEAIKRGGVEIVSDDLQVNNMTDIVN